ncbi:MAG: lamin tail domain-containing protein, partial [Anaerolineales bacterium]|nr:lamin tail domain-containing protein [Anaerolineales bacterium]
ALSWTDAVTGSQAPDGYLILGETDATITDPTDGTAVSDDTDASDNTLAMSITHGSGASYTFSSLTASTTYYFEIFSYTNSGSSIDYKTDGTIVTANATTGTTPDFVINEILADPDGSTGDANGDGAVSTTNDEFVEIINNSGITVDISNWVIADGYGDRHTIASGTSLLDQEALVVFGGGTPTNINGHVFTASTGSLSLNNGGDDVTLKDAVGGTIVTYTYGAEGGDNQSIARDGDLSGAFAKHSTIAETGGVNFSPGRKNSSIGAYQPFNLTISGNAGFRMMSSPVAGQVYADLLSELWTQGMTSADVTSGDANVWTYDGSSWSALSNLNTASQTAGEGFLVYVYANTDNSGGDDLPVTLSVSGTANTNDVSVTTVYEANTTGGVSSSGWNLVGNPYASTIDVDATGGLFDDNTTNF